MIRFILTLCAFPALTCADALIPIIPFAGSFNEGLEGFPNYIANGNAGNSVLTIMGGEATFTSTVPGVSTVWIYEPSAGATWGLGVNGSATVHSGTKGAGMEGVGAGFDETLTFVTPVLDFGGYFAVSTTTVESDITLTFFDVSGTQIGTSQIVGHSGNTMDWFGWQASVPIKSIQFGNAGNDVMPVMDDLQATVGQAAVPEPSLLALEAIALLGLVAFSRKVLSHLHS